MGSARRGTGTDNIFWELAFPVYDNSEPRPQSAVPLGLLEITVIAEPPQVMLVTNSHNSLAGQMLPSPLGR